MFVNRLLLWGIVASGVSAAYFWKKLNPGKSLNPTVGFGRVRTHGQFNGQFGGDD